MAYSENDRVNAFLEDTQLVSPERLEPIMAVRQVFMQAHDEIVEDIKYGGIVFQLSGALVGGIYTYKDHFSIEFSRGAEIGEPYAKMLEGGGKKRRHHKVFDGEALDQDMINGLVHSAVEIEGKG